MDTDNLMKLFSLKLTQTGTPEQDEIYRPGVQAERDNLGSQMRKASSDFAVIFQRTGRPGRTTRSSHDFNITYNQSLVHKKELKYILLINETKITSGS